MKRELEHAFRHVPKMELGPSYVPLNQLPKGAEVEIHTYSEVITLKIDIWPTLLATSTAWPNDTVLPVKPIRRIITPGAPCDLNYFDKKVNHRLTIDGIHSIIVGQFRLIAFDKKASKKRPMPIFKRTGNRPLRDRQI